MPDKQFRERLENIKEDLYGQTFQDTKTQEEFDIKKQNLVKMITCEMKKVEKTFDNKEIPEESARVHETCGT
jgi:hypothetical protein